MTESRESAAVSMNWLFEYKDEDGKIVHVDEGKNLIVDEGLDYMLTNDMSAATLYVGLTDGTPTPAAGDTMASHAGWAEVTSYSEGSRPAWGQGEPSSGAITNATSVDFSFSGSTTIGGGFLTTNATKGGTTGTLFSVKAATEGDRALVGVSTLAVTITLTAASS